MLKIRRGKQGNTPVTTELDILGNKIEIEVIPCPSEDFIKDIRKFQKVKMVHNPVTRSMERIVYFDDDDESYKTIADDKLDKYLVNFSGVADETGKEIDGTLRENKILLGSVMVEDTEDITIIDEEGGKGTIRNPRRRSVRQIIFEKIQELASNTIEEQVKN